MKSTPSTRFTAPGATTTATSSTGPTGPRCAASPACPPSSQDVTEVEYRQLRLERVVLVGVWTDRHRRGGRASLRELAALAETAGSQVLDGVIQRRDQPDPATYIGSGKAKELRDIVAETGADTVICDGELAPAQLIHLEDVVKVKVVDRTALILDIFAQHAKSREGKAQVALAQMQYMLPRLRGWGQSLSRQMGGGGRRGAAVSPPAVPVRRRSRPDRRRIREKMAKLRREIADDGQGPRDQAAGAAAQPVPSVAIAGYTNAGKSSLLNRLTGAGVLVENSLFATLDPTVRRAETAGGRGYTLADTVGFVRHLPHQLVEAFRSTLEEVGGRRPDPARGRRLATPTRRARSPRSARCCTRSTRPGPGDRGVQQGRRRRPGRAAPGCCRREPHAIVVSARTGQGMDKLLAAIERRPAAPRRRGGRADPVRPRRPDLPDPPAGRTAQRDAPGDRHACAGPGGRPR